MKDMAPHEGTFGSVMTDMGNAIFDAQTVDAQSRRPRRV